MPHDLRDTSMADRLRAEAEAKRLRRLRRAATAFQSVTGVPPPGAGAAPPPSIGGPPGQAVEPSPTFRGVSLGFGRGTEIPNALMDMLQRLARRQGRTPESAAAVTETAREPPSPLAATLPPAADETEDEVNRLMAQRAAARAKGPVALQRADRLRRDEQAFEDAIHDVAGNVPPIDEFEGRTQPRLTVSGRGAEARLRPTTGALALASRAIGTEIPRTAEETEAILARGAEFRGARLRERNLRRGQITGRPGEEVDIGTFLSERAAEKREANILTGGSIARLRERKQQEGLQERLLGVEETKAQAAVLAALQGGRVSAETFAKIAGDLAAVGIPPQIVEQIRSLAEQGGGGGPPAVAAPAPAAALPPPPPPQVLEYLETLDRAFATGAGGEPASASLQLRGLQQGMALANLIAQTEDEIGRDRLTEAAIARTRKALRRDSPLAKLLRKAFTDARDGRTISEDTLARIQSESAALRNRIGR